MSPWRMPDLKGPPEERTFTPWFHGWGGSPEEMRRDPATVQAKADQAGRLLLLPWLGSWRRREDCCVLTPNDDITYSLGPSPKRVVMGNQERSKQPDNFPPRSPETCTKLMDPAQPFPRPCRVAARPCGCLTAWRTSRLHEGPSGG